MTKQVVIIGAGPGGLAAAMLMARSGANVKLIERLDRIGGRTATLHSQHDQPDSDTDYKFDLGPTFFLYPRILEEIFAACGHRLQREVDLIRLDPQYHLVFEQGGEIKATPVVQRMQAEIAKLNPQDAQNLPRYLNENRSKLEAFRPILENPFLSWRDCLNPAVLKSLPLVRPTKSVDKDLRRYFSDPRVRLSFSFQSKYLGMSPFQCPSLFTILSFLEYEFGVFHPRGGCGAISNKMAQLAQDMGVEIMLDEKVTEMRFAPGTKKCTGVKTDKGHEYNADAVVVNADFARAMGSLVPDHLRKRWTNRKLEKKKFSCSTFMMYLGLEGEFPDLEHHTIHLAKDYEKNLQEIERDHLLSENPSFYVQNACKTDDSMAPKGHSTLYVLAPVTHEHKNVDWQTQTAPFREKIFKQMQKLGLPPMKQLEKRIRYEKILTPVGWRDELEIFKGATFNLAHNFKQMLHLRPRNRFEDLQNVYLVGGGTHPGSGLPVIYESARITSRLMTEDLGLDPIDARRPVEHDNEPDSDADADTDADTDAKSNGHPVPQLI